MILKARQNKYMKKIMDRAVNKIETVEEMF